LWDATPSEKPNEPFFLNTGQTTPNEKEEEPYYFDPSDDFSEKKRRGRTFHLSMDYNLFMRSAQVDKFLDDIDDEELLGHHEPFDALAFAMRTKATIPEAEKLQPFLAWQPLEVIRRTLENMTQLARIRHDRVLQMHMKPWFLWLNRNRLHETVATDTMFSSVPDVSGHTCAQVYWGLSSYFLNVYGMQTKSKGPRTLNDFAHKEGVPPIMQSDNSCMQRWGTSWLKCMREWLCQPEFTEPLHPQQNPAELWAAKWLKCNSRILRQWTGAPENTWLYTCQYMADIHNVTSDKTLDWKTPWEKQCMETPNISAYLQFQFYERIYYLYPTNKFPST